VAAPPGEDREKVWYIFRVPEYVGERAGSGRESSVGSEDNRKSPLIEALKALQPGVQPVGTAAAIGYSLIGSIAFLGALGYAFDRWLGTGPTGLVVGLLLGVVVGLYILAKELWHR
jgi:F0F1-type ATP synthase assembly protein I